MEPITSLHNPRVKAAVRLRDRRGRDKQRRILIDGTREIARALQAGVQPIEVFVSPELCTSNASRELLGELSRRQIALLHVAPAVFEKLAYGARSEGLIAVAEPPRQRLADLRLPERALVAVLVGVEKPGNVGAVLRSADAAGAAAVIVADAGTDLYNPNCIRASLGTVFTLPVCAVTSAEAIDYLRAQRLKIFAARLDAATDYRQISFGLRSAIVLGSEADGLADPWRAADITPIKLPMLGVADSLNVSVTAAVLFYQALRQREDIEVQSKAADVDSYLAQAPADRRPFLIKLRQQCGKNLKGYEEAMAYGMPAYKKNGTVEVAFASQKQYISVYIAKAAVLNSYRPLLTGLSVGKGCIRYKSGTKIDYAVLGQILRATARSKEKAC